MLNPSKLAISLDRDGEEPIYRQLIRHIRAQIESGTLNAGTRLPASRDLARFEAAPPDRGRGVSPRPGPLRPLGG